MYSMASSANCAWSAIPAPYPPAARARGQPAARAARRTAWGGRRRAGPVQAPPALAAPGVIPGARSGRLVNVAVPRTVLKGSTLVAGARAAAGHRRAQRARAAALALAAASALGLAGCAGPAPPTGLTVHQFSPARAARAGGERSPAVPPGSLLSGYLRAPGGPYLRDRYGRVVFLHGVNAVYKLPPYELVTTPGLPWSFTAADARQIAALGFDVVRLGILWQGLEPGRGGPNDPAVCTPGRPGNPHMYDASALRAYLADVTRVVDLLGRSHVYTLLDMHQDVVNQGFGGEGWPDWALCTDGLPIVRLPGRWSRNYANPALQVAVEHFWTNDVVGNLQGEYDRVWQAVARTFRSNPWVVGYDPYNEPFGRAVVTSGDEVFASQLECFYTGRARAGRLGAEGTPVPGAGPPAGAPGGGLPVTGGSGETPAAGLPVRCPPGVPAVGLVPTIERADPHHLVCVGPDIYSIRNRPNLLGSMDFPRLVLNFHSYCSERSPVTGDPTNVDVCASQQLNAMLRRLAERPDMASRAQPGGPAWFMSEFGATRNVDLMARLTSYADLLQLGCAYWSWKYYDDPTGSSHEALASSTGQLEPTAL